MTDALFNDAPVTIKYDTWEPDALKTKAINADSHIATLEAENAELRKYKETDAKLQEVLARLDQVNQLQNTPPNSSINQTSERPSSSEQITKADIEKLVSMSIEQEQKKNSVKSNVDKVESELIKAWGVDYKKSLNSRATELGVAKDFLGSMAENYPDAFLKLVLEDKRPTNPNAHVPPSSATTVQQYSGTENWNYFKTQMKTNPALRSDSAFQNRMAAAAQRLGDSFYR